MCIPVLSARLLSTLYFFSEVFEFVYYKYSLQPSLGIFVGTMFFCTYWVVYLPSLPFSFIKLSRTYRIFRYWKSLQCLQGFSLCWFTLQTITVLFVIVTTTASLIWHDQRTFSHKRNWHCVLSLTVMVDCNGPVTTAGFAYNTYRFCLQPLQILPATITGFAYTNYRFCLQPLQV